MRNMKVATKLIIGFLIVTILAVAIGVVGIFSLTSAADNTSLMSDRTTIAIIAARMNRNVQAQRAAFRGAAVYHVMSMDTERDNELNTVNTLIGDFDAMSDQVSAMLVTGEGKRIMGEIESSYIPFADARDAYLSTILDPAISDEEMMVYLGNVASTVATLATNVTALVDLADTLTTQMAADAAATAASTTIIMIAILAAAVAISLFLAIYISRLISNPLKDMMGYIKQAGETGNLHFKDEEWANCDKLSKGKDEIGQTMKAFTQMMRKFVYYGETLHQVAERDLTVKVETLGPQDTFGVAITTMTDNLNSIFEEINTASSQVSTGSHQVADGAQALAAGSTEQAASVQELSSSISEVAERTKDNSVKADQAAMLANTIKNSAEKGSEQMDDMIKSVRDINDASQSISKVIKTIDDIAFQTNILALNAAVEAARAGQHGKGFAVVAEEVRNLSAKSAQAAKDTESLIADSMLKAEHGVKVAGETASSLSDIVSGINESTALVTEIARASEEQSLSISQINVGIDQVAKVVQQNSATAEESAAASEEMSSQAAVLQELISQFQIKDEKASRMTGASNKLRSSNQSASDSKEYGMTFGDGEDFGKY